MNTAGWTPDAGRFSAGGGHCHRSDFCTRLWVPESQRPGSVYSLPSPPTLSPTSDPELPSDWASLCGQTSTKAVQLSSQPLPSRAELRAHDSGSANISAREAVGRLEIPPLVSGGKGVRKFWAERRGDLLITLWAVLGGCNSLSGLSFPTVKWADQTWWMSGPSSGSYTAGNKAPDQPGYAQRQRPFWHTLSWGAQIRMPSPYTLRESQVWPQGTYQPSPSTEEGEEMAQPTLRNQLVILAWPLTAVWPSVSFLTYLSFLIHKMGIAPYLVGLWWTLNELMGIKSSEQSSALAGSLQVSVTLFFTAIYTQVCVCVCIHIVWCYSIILLLILLCYMNYCDSHATWSRWKTRQHWQYWAFPVVSRL